MNDGQPPSPVKIMDYRDTKLSLSCNLLARETRIYPSKISTHPLKSKGLLIEKLQYSC